MTEASNHQEKHQSLHHENQQLRKQVVQFQEQIMQLQQRVAWFEKQLFGRKSEKRIIDNPKQTKLFEWLGEAAPKPQDEKKQTVTYERGTQNKRRGNDCETECGLRFNADVPVETIRLDPPELQGEHADQYEVIDTKVTHKLAQRPASYVVLRYERPVIKEKQDKSHNQTLITAPMLPQVLDNSLADVSFLVGLLCDKFIYHLPLYRQHQRLQHAGITLARSTLTNLVAKVSELLRPIVAVQLRHILQSKILAMDETPIKASRKSKGNMKQAWFWPLYGEDDEVVFTYSESRGRLHIENLLKTEFTGTLLSDGHSAYASYVATENKKEEANAITAAQCWVHTRRKFVEAETMTPEDVDHVLNGIAALYEIEKQISTKKLTGDKKKQVRLECSKPIVDQLFQWGEDQLNRLDLTPSHPLRKAINYLLKRRAELSVFIADPDLPLDTNHLERTLRCIPMGRKNWLFCWTELGAEHVGIIQSLLTTCKLHDVNPWVYLTDVLQRISIHPNSQIEELTPRRWKTLFADDPMTCILDIGRQ